MITLHRKRYLTFFPKSHQQRSGYKQLWNSRNMWRAQKYQHYLESEYATFHRSKTLPHSYFLPVGGQCLYSGCVCQEEHFCTCSSSSCWSARSFASAWRMARLSISSIAGSGPKHFHRITAFCRLRMEILSSPDLPFSQYQEVAAFCPILAARLAFLEVGSEIAGTLTVLCSDQEAEHQLSWLLPWFLTSSKFPGSPHPSSIWLHCKQIKSPSCSIMLVFLRILIKPVVIPGNKLEKKHSTQCLITYFVAVRLATVLSLPCVRKIAR